MHAIIRSKDGIKTALEVQNEETKVFVPEGSELTYKDFIDEPDIVKSYDDEGEPTYYEIEEPPKRRVEREYSTAIASLLSDKKVHAKGISYPELTKAAYAISEDNPQYNASELVKAALASFGL